jgi:hypothetical protein
VIHAAGISAGISLSSAGSGGTAGPGSFLLSKTAERYDTEPETGEGRKELAARAKQAEKKRDYALAGYHRYEVASAAVQIAIVLASAAIITGIAALSWIAAGLGIVGVAFCGIGFFAPTAVHLF